jgi:transposase-like protein
VSACRLAEVVLAGRRRWPKAPELVGEAEDSILTHIVFPAELWNRIYSTSPLAWLNMEAKRRTNLVGVLPDAGLMFRLAGAVLLEIADE